MSLLLSSGIPVRLEDGIGIKLKIEAYCIALEDVDLDDLGKVVHQCIIGDPKKYEWCPQPAEIRQLCRDRQAVRENADKPKVEAKYSAFEPTPSERRTELAEYARKVAAQIGEPLSPEEWVQARIKDGTIQ